MRAVSRFEVMIAALFALLALGSVAEAYPQFQLSKAQTCSACHYSPSGGGLLNGMGQYTASELLGDDDEASDPSFLSGKWTPPSWLALGGDFRFGAGVSGRGKYGPKVSPGAFPMQGDLYARMGTGHITAHVTFGLRGAVGAGKVLSFLQSKEHYVMWRQNKKDGAYVRAGRFMAPYGLRLVDHAAYTQRYSGTDLFSETYGVSAGIVTHGYEFHATAFVHDVLRDPVEPGDGGAFYGEVRLGDAAAVGVSGRYAKGPDETRKQAGLTAKIWFESLNTLVQAQVDGINQSIRSGPSRKQLVAYILGTYFWKSNWHYELGVGHFDEDISIGQVGRDAVDTNLRYVYGSHLEFEWNNRVQLIGMGSGGPTSFFSLLQVHYRL